MKNFIANKKVVALFVEDILLSSKQDWQSITITPLDISEGYFVSIVTDISSADIAEKLELAYCLLDTTTYPENTQDG